jgi:hypothetical protein
MEAQGLLTSVNGHVVALGSHATFVQTLNIERSLESTISSNPVYTSESISLRVLIRYRTRVNGQPHHRLAIDLTG